VNYICVIKVNALCQSTGPGLHCTAVYVLKIYDITEVQFLPCDASAERGNATVSRPSVCLSVRPSVCP